jgi:hypothetical protein
VKFARIRLSAEENGLPRDPARNHPTIDALDFCGIPPIEIQRGPFSSVIAVDQYAAAIVEKYRAISGTGSARTTPPMHECPCSGREDGNIGRGSR